MGENRTLSIMLFVLGIALIAIGIGISTITQAETRYQNILGIQVPYEVAVQPYVGVGIVMVIVGAVAVVGALVNTARGKSITNVQPTQTLPPVPVSKPPEQALKSFTGTTFPQTCRICGAPLSEEDVYCRKCGTVVSSH
jgi:hypothetical protein